MGCSVRRNRHGFLAYRLFWKGMESHEGTGLRDTPRNRQKVEARAQTMNDEIEADSFDYLRWFPEGNKAAVLRPTPAAEAATPLTVRQYAEREWLPRKVPPLVRATLSDTYKKHLAKHVYPRFADLPFSAVTVSALESLRAELIDPQRKGLKVKTARCIIDASFRALFRDARKDGHASGDPFADLGWPRKVDPTPDPFTEEERDTLVSYFRERDTYWFPLVQTLFFTGLRTGEVIGLRYGTLDIRAGKLTVRISRTKGEDNAPKTARSERTITLLPEVVEALRVMPAPLHLTPDTFVFRTPTGLPIDRDRFTAQHWHRALRATAVRPRKFYATRHTFISAALSRGVNIKWLADYCGTSVDMIERHYARWLHDDGGQLALLRAAPLSPCAEPKKAAIGGQTRNLSRNLPAPAKRSPANPRTIKQKTSGGGEIRTPEGF
jgi:integrase